MCQISHQIPSLTLQAQQPQFLSFIDCSCYVLSMCLLQVNVFDLSLSVHPLLQPHASMLSVRHKSAKWIKDSLRALMLPSLWTPLFKHSRMWNAFQTLWSHGGVCIVYVGDGRLLPLQFYSVFRHLLQARGCNGKERNLLCCRQSY